MLTAAAALLLFIGVSIAAVIYPLSTTWLSLGLASYAALLWRQPGVALPAALALLPLLDFSPWSGWALLSEFDLLVAVTVGVGLLRKSSEPTTGLTLSGRWIVGLVTLSFLMSAAIGFLPAAPVDANALFGPYTTWTSLRQLKGFLWALALLPLLIDEARDPQRLERRFTLGMVLGLAGVVLVILWQREAFAGLLDFARVYRVEGPFPELHTGGGDMHAYLVVAIPFIVAWGCERPSALRIGAAGTLFLLATYAVGVTFTRGAYVGYATAFIVICVALVRCRLPANTVRVRRLAAVAGLAMIGIVVLVPIVSGSFMEARLSGTQAEAITRTRHWARAIGMMDRKLSTTLFGMGLGSFPKTLLVEHPEAASATFSFEHEGDNGYLKLGSGRPLYLDQRVAVVPGETYTLALEVRSSAPGATLHAMLCEKSIQYSFRCASASLRPDSTRVWQHREAALNAGEIGSGPWPFRPVALSLTNPRIGTVIDVDDVRLLDSAGRDLVVNGDFSAGGARWFFAADDHLPWHVFDLWVAVLFEQGWLGVLAVGGMVALAIRNDAISMWRGDLYAGMVLASLAGFLAVGLTESLFDGPRVTTLFFLVLFLGLARSAHASGRTLRIRTSAQRGSASGGPHASSNQVLVPLWSHCRVSLHSKNPRSLSH